MVVADVRLTTSHWIHAESENGATALSGPTTNLSSLAMICKDEEKSIKFSNKLLSADINDDDGNDKTSADWTVDDVEDAPADDDVEDDDDDDKILRRETQGPGPWANTIILNCK